MAFALSSVIIIIIFKVLWLFFISLLVFFFCKLGSLSNSDGEGCENFIWKVNSRCFKLNRAYFISFMPNSSNVGRFRWSWILRDCIEVLEERKKVIFWCPRPPKNAKLSIFTSYSCSHGRECRKRRGARARVLFCQSVNLFLFCRSRFNLSIIVTGQQPTGIICEPCRKPGLGRRSFLTAKSSPNGRER